MAEVSIKSSTDEVFFQFNDSIAKKIVYDADGATGVTDFSHTLLRLWQVFSALFAYGTIESADHPDSSYNQMLHGGLPPENYTPQYTIEWVLGLGVVFPLMLGGYSKAKHLESQVEPLKIAYQLDRKRDLRPESDQDLARTSPHGLLADYDDLINREKVIIKPPVAGPSPSPTFTDRWLSYMERIWISLANSAAIFWPVWMSTMIMFGTAAISAVYVMPIMMAIVTGLSILVPFVFNLLRPKTTSPQTELCQTEKIRATRELIQRRHFKDQFTAFKEKIRAITKGTDLENALQAHSLFKTKQPTAHHGAYQTGITRDGYLTLIKNPLNSSHAPKSAEKSKKAAYTLDDKHRIEQSTLGQFLFGSYFKQYTHRFVSTAMMMLSQIGATFFILWFLSSTFGAAALVTPASFSGIFTNLANLLSGNSIGAITGFTIASLITLKVFRQESQAKFAFREKVFSKLSEIYKPHSGKKYSGKTKEQVFHAFQADIAQLVDRLLTVKIQLQKKAANQVTALDKEILAYDISNVDVLKNDYFFAKQKQAMSNTWLAKTLIRVYHSLYGAQSGVFIARMLFLSGGIAASVCLSFGSYALVGFLAIAALCAVIVGSIRATLYQLNRESQNSKAFLDTFDAKLSFMNKTCKTLSILLTNQTPVVESVAIAPQLKPNPVRLRQENKPVVTNAGLYNKHRNINRHITFDDLSTLIDSRKKS